nr:MAG TPA: hypothetical protein [Caudoviricetes sp.]
MKFSHFYSYFFIFIILWQYYHNRYNKRCATKQIKRSPLRLT